MKGIRNLNGDLTAIFSLNAYICTDLWVIYRHQISCGDVL